MADKLRPYDRNKCDLFDVWCPINWKLLFLSKICVKLSSFMVKLISYQVKLMQHMKLKEFLRNSRVLYAVIYMLLGHRAI